MTTLVAAGFLTFFFFQRALVLHHRDDPDEARAHHRVGALGAAALSVHSSWTVWGSVSRSASAR